MNERIKSLLAKAHLDVMEDHGDIDSNRVAEKFAELIIKECTDIIDQEALEERDDWAMRRIESCSWMIKDNFGIKQ